MYGEWSSTFQFLGVKNGKKLKLIKCCDCGKDVIIDAKSRTIRCENCKQKERSMAASISRKKKMLTSSL